MSRKPSRVPPTLSDKLERLRAVASEHSSGPGVYRLSVAHDDDCPALQTQKLIDCTCEPEIRSPERVA